MPELVVILVVALVVLGPQRLPELARTLGRAMAEFRRQTTDLMDDFQAETTREDRLARAATKAVPETPPPGSTATTGDKPGPS